MLLPVPLARSQAQAGELATLLTLQLSRLPPPSLAQVVQAVGELRAAPKFTWVDTATAVVERATSRCAPALALPPPPSLVFLLLTLQL